MHYYTVSCDKVVQVVAAIMQYIYNNTVQKEPREELLKVKMWEDG